MCGRLLNLALAALLNPGAVDQLEEFAKHDLQRRQLVARAGANQARGLVVRYAGLARVVDVEQPRVDAMLEQRQVRCVLQIVADVALVEVHDRSS
ncbi:hypothetical protein WJ04_09065 [Burkholderia vietnamiensis]|nr:hypothetical protein WJ04_09065 [Burkholderia vietnamiensis]